MAMQLPATLDLLLCVKRCEQQPLRITAEARLFDPWSTAVGWRGYKARWNLTRKVLDFIQFGGPGWDRTNDQPVMSRLLYH